MKYIKNYDIDVTKPEGQKAMIEIAKLAAQNNAQETIKCIDNYLIQTDTDEGKQKFKELCNYIFICLIKQSDSFDYDNIVDKFIDYSKKINGNGTDSYQVDYLLFYDQMEKLKKQKVIDVLEGVFQKPLLY